MVGAVDVGVRGAAVRPNAYCTPAGVVRRWPMGNRGLGALAQARVAPNSLAVAILAVRVETMPTGFMVARGRGWATARPTPGGLR